MDIRHNAGQFSISTFGGQIFSNEKLKEEFKAMMDTVFVIGAIHIQTMDTIMYTALSEQFEKLKINEPIPNYLPLFEHEDGKVKKVTWVLHEAYNTSQKKKELDS